ncbi:MAG: hypothetical protein JHC33_04930 [Ignisphaera sp.]|nr:hypothetical protein [Ignisphaera sp.]
MGDFFSGLGSFVGNNAEGIGKGLGGLASLYGAYKGAGLAQQQLGLQQQSYFDEQGRRRKAQQDLDTASTSAFGVPSPASSLKSVYGGL